MNSNIRDDDIEQLIFDSDLESYIDYEDTDDDHNFKDDQCSTVSSSEDEIVQDCSNSYQHRPVGRSRGRATQTQQSLNTLWRSDDSTINDYPYNPQTIQVGLYPDIIDALAETNRFAAQKIASFKNLSPHSRLRAWYDTDIGEIKNFLGVVLWMGLVQLLFKQYIKNKSHKYGVKIFKLCVPPCYTLAMKVYAGKEADQNISVSAKIVIDLAAEYLNFGRTMYVDNWYTSVHLADLLGEQKTHLVGTLRSNRKQNPKEAKKRRIMFNENVVNASILFKKVTGSKISITDFRSLLVERLTIKESLHPDINPDLKHILEKVGRSRCFKCYKQNSREKGRKIAQLITCIRKTILNEDDLSA
ncbi:piggyBac transposable element-derived protein 4-like [Aphis craccivora]|uniref:PiggyBac transposable element-derived protein 4-like n=1 Tax=Aphis craccivora TaxID=307492 RepID=A0A6G0Y7U4_APHCR|nr:piggyBac transposable element-derived protein 4-like [Aphis craccivora]